MRGVVACALAVAGIASPCGADVAPFGTVTLAPDLDLDGAGTNVDSLAFFEAPSPEDTLLFVTAKDNQRVEVWRFPFAGNEQAPLVHPSFGSGTRVNGIAIDQAVDRLYIAVSSPESTVSVFSLPALAFLGEFIAGAVNLRSEPNLALLGRPDGARWLYVSADRVVYVHDAESGAAIASWIPVAGLETMAADELAQVIYVPDENGGSGVYAYDPLGAPPLRDGTNLFGAGVFDGDAEGVALYRCPESGEGDAGSGFLVVADQRADRTEFEFFDLGTRTHLGALVLDGVANTDGIASTQRPLPGWPQGLFAAIDDDRSTVLVGWDRILTATGLFCPAVLAAPAPEPASRAFLALALAAALAAAVLWRRRVRGDRAPR